MQSRNPMRSSCAAILVMGMMVLAGCATRGYVRTEVETNAQELSARINENQDALEQTRQELGADIEALNTSTEGNSQQIQETRNQIDEARTEIAEVRDVANEARDTASTTASTVVARIDSLERLGERGLELKEQHTILFNFDSAELQADEYTVELQAVRNMVNQNPNMVLVLEGHTDAVGDPAYNQVLGERRVEAVKRYLITDLGVPIYRIYGFSYGESQGAGADQTPITSTSSADTAQIDGSVEAQGPADVQGLGASQEGIEASGQASASQAASADERQMQRAVVMKIMGPPTADAVATSQD